MGVSAGLLHGLDVASSRPAGWNLKTQPKVSFTYISDELCVITIGITVRCHPAPPSLPPPCLLAGVTALLVNKSFPAQVTFRMFNLREDQMCSEKETHKQRASLLFMSVMIFEGSSPRLFLFEVKGIVSLSYDNQLDLLLTPMTHLYRSTTEQT